MNHREMVVACAEMMNLRFMARGGTNRYRVRYDGLWDWAEMTEYNPSTNGNQLMELIEEFSLNVQWSETPARGKTVRVICPDKKLNLQQHVGRGATLTEAVMDVISKVFEYNCLKIGKPNTTSDKGSTKLDDIIWVG